MLVRDMSGLCLGWYGLMLEVIVRLARVADSISGVDLICPTFGHQQGVMERNV